MPDDLLQTLTKYRAWADRLTYAALSRVPEHELTKARPTTFGTISHTLHHIQIVDEIFQAHLEGRTHGHVKRTQDSVPRISTLEERATELSAWWIELPKRLPANRLSEPIEFRFVSGKEGRMTAAEIIQHVVTHATYHRGYVDDMMYQIPIEPPATDLSVFLSRPD